MNSVSVENFLKTLYTLRYDEKKKTSATNLSERLSISNPAVTDMAKKLAAKGYIDYAPYKAMLLTKEGEKVAIRVLRRHRLWELFLHKVLDLDLKEVHQEAELLEHQTSDKLTKCIDEFLGCPDFDPHGDPIPKDDGTVKVHENALRLNELNEGDECTVLRLIYGSGDLNDFFTHYDIEPNQTLKITKCFKLDESIEVEKNEKRFAIPLPIQRRMICTKK